MSITTSVFAAIFWRFSPEKDVFKIPTILNAVLTDNVFILTTLSLYLFFFNIGFGPVKNTLLCELFTPTEQVQEPHCFFSSFTQEIKKSPDLETTLQKHVYSCLFSPPVPPQAHVAGLVHLTYWLCSFLATKLFHLLVQSWGLATLFLAISSTCLASLAFTATVVTETRIKNGLKTAATGHQDVACTNEGFDIK